MSHKPRTLVFRNASISTILPEQPMTSFMLEVFKVVAAGVASHYASLYGFQPVPALDEALPDLIHDSLPEGFCDQAGQGSLCVGRLMKFWATSGPDKCVVVSLVVFACVLFSGNASHTKHVIRLFMRQYSSLVMVRSLSIVVTTYPSPSPLCKGVSRLDQLPKEGWFLTPIYCSDLMPSGHSLLQTLMLFHVLSAPVPRALKCAFGAWYVFSLLTSVLLRDHYTADVVMAVALVSCLFDFEQCSNLWRSNPNLRRLRKRVNVVIFAVIVTFLAPFALFATTLRYLCSSQSPSGKIIRTPETCFDKLVGFPFPPLYTTIKSAHKTNEFRVHYTDTSTDQAVRGTILLLHGEPSWSFLYRSFIDPLSAGGYRVITMDFAGFGRSDKFASMSDYSHELHRRTLIEFCFQLDLENVTLVVQDWGGLTGLSCVRDMPNRISSLVIMNTGLPTGIDIYNVTSALPFLIWRSCVMIFGSHLPVGLLFACAFGRTTDLEGYCAPFPSAAYKAGVAKWPLLVPIFPWMPVAKDMRSARKFLSTWEKPTLIAFSDKDPITKGADRDIGALIPACKKTKPFVVKGAGHFLQDTHGDIIVTAILDFLQGDDQKKEE